MNLQHLKMIAVGLALFFACTGCAFYLGAPGEYPYYRNHHHFFEFEWYSSVHPSPHSGDRLATEDNLGRRG